LDIMYGCPHRTSQHAPHIRHAERRVRDVVCLLIVVAATSAASCAREDSYVYLYDCSGAITKFNVNTKEELASWEPAEMPGLADLVPLPIRDGCVLNNVRYDRARGRFIAVAPAQATATAADTQRYVLLALETSNMGVAAHAALPGSATMPNVSASNEGEIVVAYEVSRANEPNETWLARYDGATLEAIGAPTPGAPPSEVAPERRLPPEIPLADKFTHPVFADR
jgi:hypothetical protein